MNHNYSFDIFVLLLLFVILTVASACTTEPIRMYNSDDIEDLGCYNRFGAELGYCLATRADNQ